MTGSANQELVEQFEQFYRRYYSEEVGELARHYPRKQKSLTIDWADLYQFDADLAEDFVAQPDQVRDHAEEALRLYDLPVDVSLAQAHVRIQGLEQAGIGELRAEHISTLVSIQGTVETTRNVKSRPVEAAFECQRCGTLNLVPQSVVGELQEPHECMGCERQGPFQVNVDKSEYVDQQWVRVQERPAGQHMSADIASVMVSLEDDLVDSVEPGDSVVVTGVVRLDDDMDASITDKYLEADDVTAADPYSGLELSDEDKLRIQELAESDDLFDRLTESVAPTVPDQEDVKRGILYQLFGGVRKEFEDGTTTRGTIHIGIVGDPGTQKADLLQAATKLAPRSLQTGGKTTTSVGLTAAAERTSGQHQRWELRAGTLVLGDQGLVAVDNFDDMDGSKQEALHEPMEKQRVSVSKGSINRVLRAETSVLTASEPVHGRFDEYQAVGEQLGFTPDLVDAFDLVFICLDGQDERELEETVDHFLDVNRQQSVIEDGSDISPLDPELLQKYVAYARSNHSPQLTEGASEKLKDYYIERRSETDDTPAPAPVNRSSLATLMRLSEASARIRLSENVTEADAERAIKLFDRTLSDLGLDTEMAEYDSELIETGTVSGETDQRKQNKGIKEVINEIQSEYENGAPLEEILEEAENLGYSPGKVESEIENLKQKGEIYQPAQDHFRAF